MNDEKTIGLVNLEKAFDNFNCQNMLESIYCTKNNFQVQSTFLGLSSVKLFKLSL